jgi:hypothetical protein
MNPSRLSPNGVSPRFTCIFVGILVGTTLAATRSAPGDQVSTTPAKLQETMTGGLHGYISMKVPPPPDGFGFGISFYSAAWPLLAEPLQSFQIGLPGTWILPDNRGYERPLCPPGTIARDRWAERGPSYRDVFQTIEGGMGFWRSTQFPSATPKFRMNGTATCYNVEISSPGWGFGKPDPLASATMGLVQISNRLVVPPDGLTFANGMHGELFGTAWMALPLMESAAAHHDQPTGDQSWTLFLNAGNFKGPVAFWIPDTWSAIANGYAPAAGRTLDARPAVMGGGAMEVNTVPYFSNTDSHNVLYSRIPKLLFPTDASNKTVLMQDVLMYSRDALSNPLKSWGESSGRVTGAFDKRGTFTPTCTNLPLRFDQHRVPLTGFEAFVETTMIGGGTSCSFGLAWKESPANFPEYFKQDGDKMVAVRASAVPPETALLTQTFAPADTGKPYTSPTAADSNWVVPGPRSALVTALLADGSRITYAWYRFVDQPALQHLRMSIADKAKLQKLIERIHSDWPVTRDYMAPPTSGTLATIDAALTVTLPRGMEVGYVPIVTRQEAARGQQR